MGRYAQARTRGGQRWSGPVAPASLVPPPAPYIEMNWTEEDWTLILRSNADPSNVGGLFVLETSFNGADWLFYSTYLNEGSGVPVHLSHSWDNCYVRAFESGNGSSYAGMSEQSDASQLEPP